MQPAPHHNVERSIAGALSWWREAGVDCAFSDEALPWLSEPVTEAAQPSNESPRQQQPAAPPLPVPELPRIGGDRAAWPQDLAAFDAWWRSEPTLDAGRITQRISPRGPVAAELMVLVEQPEADDREELLTGPQGRLLAAILRAMGLAPEQVRFASVLPSHTPMPDWQALHAAGIGEVLRHHVQLSAPKRLISFGGNIPPLLGHDPAQSPANLPEFNHEGRIIPLLAERSLDALSRARAKAAFWQRWLDWTGK